MEYTVSVRVMRREYEPGKKRIHHFEFFTEVTGKVGGKYGLFRQCTKEYGRCAGKIPLGWKFEKVELFSDGSKRWVEYRVTVVDGAEPTPGFKLTNGKEIKQ